jgi:hypothetical protein
MVPETGALDIAGGSRFSCRNLHEALYLLVVDFDDLGGVWVEGVDLLVAVVGADGEPGVALYAPIFETTTVGREEGFGGFREVFDEAEHGAAGGWFHFLDCDEGIDFLEDIEERFAVLET